MVRVKVCGIKTVDDARAALEAGADAIGLNFVEGTPRAIDVDTAREISEVIDGRALRVGVFRDAALDRVHDVVARVGLDAVQLHGDESPEYAAQVEAPVWKVLGGDPDLAERAASFPDVELLIDHPSGGGSGQGWDFAIARALIEQGRRVWVAGGLGPENVAAAVRAASPYGVDASSGLESAPGQKDAAKVRAYVEAARAAASEA